MTATVPNDVSIRRMTEADLPAVAAIYAHYVAHHTCTFAETPPTEAEWREFLDAHSGRFAAIVATSADRVIGWGSLSQWNQRCAYRYTVENSVYVHPDFHRRGAGRALLGRLIELAHGAGIRHLIAQIADHQAASERLHEAFGFRRVGCLERVGFKFGRTVDVVIWQLSLD